MKQTIEEKKASTDTLIHASMGPDFKKIVIGNSNTLKNINIVRNINFKRRKKN